MNCVVAIQLPGAEDELLIVMVWLLDLMHDIRMSAGMRAKSSSMQEAKGHWLQLCTSDVEDVFLELLLLILMAY